MKEGQKVDKNTFRSYPALENLFDMLNEPLHLFDDLVLLLSE